MMIEASQLLERTLAAAARALGHATPGDEGGQREVRRGHPLERLHLVRGHERRKVAILSNLVGRPGRQQQRRRLHVCRHELRRQ